MTRPHHPIYWNRWNGSIAQEEPHSHPQSRATATLVTAVSKYPPAGAHTGCLLCSHSSEIRSAVGEPAAADSHADVPMCALVPVTRGDVAVAAGAPSTCPSVLTVPAHARACLRVSRALRGCFLWLHGCARPARGEARVLRVHVPRSCSRPLMAQGGRQISSSLAARWGSREASSTLSSGFPPGLSSRRP